ncbi:MAG: DUF4091 domain-containing protein [Armatimonadetes bacterium]|nr:DUF4091 domain-containing protein [Armatimonadota bacterium]
MSVAAQRFSMWSVEPLAKVFHDTQAPEKAAPAIVVRCAHNEFESAQVAIRSETALTDVTVRFGAIEHEGGQYSLTAESVRWNFVGSIPLDKNTTGTPLERLVRGAPCEIPDVLLAERNIKIPANRTQSVRLTFVVPKDSPSGKYHGEVIIASSEGEVSLPIDLQVWPFALPGERHLFVTNWFSTANIARSHGVKEWSEEFWKILAAYFRNMAAHRQNVAWVPWQLIKVVREPSGKLTLDYAVFDRYVECMEKTGVADRIEIQFIASFGEGGWSSPNIEFAKVAATDRATGKTVQLDFGVGLAPLLKDLEKHLDKRGWLNKAILHICDEPSLYNVDSWRQRSRQVHAVAPRLKRIDAIEASDFGDDLDVYVPKLSHLRNWFDDYQKAKARGKELWYYICCHPFGGEYPNRFLDYPLLKVRLLHWLNYAYGIEGYLHWGLNHWGDDPFGKPSPDLPPGDTHVIYPGPEGPLDSLRWEAQRDSLEDYEYLWLLTEKLKTVKQKLGKAAVEFDPTQRGREFCSRLIKSFTEVADDPALLHSTRELLAHEIIEVDKEPLALVWTKPPAESELVPGPIVIEVYGAVQPGASVTMDGESVPVNAKGGFARVAFPSSSNRVIKVEVARDGVRRVLQREFRFSG